MKIEIPDNATNGEVVKALFPSDNADLLGIDDICVIDEKTGSLIMIANEQWWKAPYKAESEDKV